MGWQVIGQGQIEVEAKNTQEIIDLMIGVKQKVINKLYGNDNVDDFYDVKGKDGYITFEMSGNKAINYRKLELIKKYCRERNIYIDISVNEYTESQDGYYYNSKDDEEEFEDVEIPEDD